MQSVRHETVIDFNLLTGVILSTLIAYLLGALPIAVWISRRNKIDIFSVGTGLPGASNVRRQVGNVPGGQVLIGDMAKGAVAVLAARQMQVDGIWLILPCFAMVAGHWKSIFTGFRGGDGLAPLGGAILVMFPPLNGFLAALIGSMVTLGGQKLPYTSLLGLVAGIAALLWLVRDNSPEEIALAAGVTIIALLVLVHASVGHRRRNAKDEWSELDEGEGATE
jgi:glycerol-3-phosphate acyltransferase PlsY